MCVCDFSCVRVELCVCVCVCTYACVLMSAHIELSLSWGVDTHTRITHTEREVYKEFWM